MVSQVESKNGVADQNAEFGEPKSNSPLELEGDHVTLVDSTRGKHKECGGMVAAVHDEKNWPTEHILICQHCEKVITQNEYTQVVQ